jgi:hypothetical protein
MPIYSVIKMALATRSIIDKSGMDRLRKNSGRDVTLEFVDDGRPYIAVGSIGAVIDFRCVTLKDRAGQAKDYSFVGAGSAIRRISAEDGAVLYDNTHNITESFNARDSDTLGDLMRKSFGRKNANYLAMLERNADYVVL